MNIDKDIGDNPTPQQVKDYYDLHTGEGAANFSNEDAGITVQLWHSLAQALEENERLSADIGRIVIAIDTGLTDKSSLEKIKRHLMCILIDIGYVDALAEVSDE